MTVGSPSNARLGCPILSRVFAKGWEDNALHHDVILSEGRRGERSRRICFRPPRVKYLHEHAGNSEASQPSDAGGWLFTDEEFEQMSTANELVKLERTKEGKIVVNPPTGLDSHSGSTQNHPSTQELVATAPQGKGL